MANFASNIAPSSFTTAGLRGCKGEPLILSHPLVELVPLTSAHTHELLAIATRERSSFVFTHVPATLPDMEAYLKAAQDAYERGQAVPFAIISSLGRKPLIGTSRFCDLEYWPWPIEHPQRRNDGTPDAVRVGCTWLAPPWQGSEAARVARWLMLNHAFEVWKVKRLMVWTDERNARSRRAIEKIGGKLDGIWRAHMLNPDGGIRNSAVYSILSEEWKG